MNNYYTYAYLREDRTPYYIGKGKDNRAYVKRHIVNPPPKNRIIYLKQNLTEEEAFKHEIYMIAIFGRKDLGKGILYNRTNGGEGNSGLIHSEESKDKMRAAKKGSNHSDETKAKMSERNRKMGRWCGSDNPALKRKGKKLEKPFSDEHRKKLSEVQKGNQKHKGHKHSEETREKMRQKALEREAIKRQNKIS